MERPDVPLEQAQEELAHRAHDAPEPWIMGVALTAALLAVCAAITALMAEHHANEAMILEIRSSDQWSLFQAKAVKHNLLDTKDELLEGFGKTRPAANAAELSREELIAGVRRLTANARIDRMVPRSLRGHARSKISLLAGSRKLMVVGKLRACEGLPWDRLPSCHYSAKT